MQQTQRICTSTGYFGVCNQTSCHAAHLEGILGAYEVKLINIIILLNMRILLWFAIASSSKAERIMFKLRYSFSS